MSIPFNFSFFQTPASGTGGNDWELYVFNVNPTWTGDIGGFQVNQTGPAGVNNFSSDHTNISLLLNIDCY